MTGVVPILVPGGSAAAAPPPSGAGRFGSDDSFSGSIAAIRAGAAALSAPADGKKGAWHVQGFSTILRRFRVGYYEPVFSSRLPPTRRLVLGQRACSCSKGEGGD